MGDDHTPYQSLFKSWKKGRPKEDENDLDLQTLDKKVEPPKRKTIDEILQGRKDTSSDASNPQSATPRKRIDHILAGAKHIPVPVSASIHGRKLVDPISRQPIAEILSSSYQSTSRKIKPEESTVVRSEHPKSESTDNVPTSRPTEASDKLQKNRPQSSRIIFDFSAPTSSQQLNELQAKASQSIIRTNLLHKYLEIESNRSPFMTTFKSESKTENTNIGLDFGFLTHFRNTTGTTTDDLVDEFESEGQTNVPEVFCKWTQKPTHVTKAANDPQVDPRIIEMEAIGVGTDSLPPMDTQILETDLFISNRSDESSRLHKFLSNASKLMLSALNDNIARNFEASEFGFMEFARGVSSSSLNKLAMHTLHCEGTYVACANIPPNERNNNEGKSEWKNIVTIWSVCYPSSPSYFLRVWGEVSKIKMVFPSDLVICGTHCGGINVFDLRENEKYHTIFMPNVIVRTATFHSGSSEQNPHHITRIVGLETFFESEYSIQIISLDNENIIICWGCARALPGEKLPRSANSAIWSKLRIGVRHVLDLNDMFRAGPLISTCLNVWETNHKYFAIGTWNGYFGVGKILPPEIKNKVEKYYAEEENVILPIKYLDVNVSLGLFLASCGDKSIRVFKVSQEIQKMILTIDIKSMPIQVRWSKRRASCFYASFSDKICLWDLLVSDIEPIKDFPIKKFQEFQLQHGVFGENLVILSNDGMTLQSFTHGIPLLPLSSEEKQSIHTFFSICQ